MTAGSDDTVLDEVGDGIFRISTPVRFPDGSGFSFNRYLLLDDQPLLFHTGPRRMFAGTAAAIRKVMPLERLRHVSFSHVEADECGALNELLAAAPQAAPLCGRVAAMTSIEDLADRRPTVLGDGESLSLGRRTIRWLDTPHLPHAWECGMLMETTTSTLFSGDLFTQPGADNPALTGGDILGPSEAFRERFDYFAHAPNSRAQLERLAGLQPRLLACMHGSAWQGDAASLLRALADAIGAPG